MESNKQTVVLGGLIVVLLVMVIAFGFTLTADRSGEIVIVDDVEVDIIDTEDGDGTDGEEMKGDAPLLFATMTHLEGNWDFVEELESAFDRQAGYLRQAMDYAEQYDAVLTFESEMPFARAMEKWGDNVFQEALDRGMGIGTHCDISPKTDFTPDKMVEEILERKVLIDALVDPSENLGCAGAGGTGDWYAGMVGAGFGYIDGIVGFHYLAMPLSQRPDGWDDRAILSEYFHNPAPEEDDRYYLFRISRVGFTPDSDGDLVVSSGDIGEISSIGDLEGLDGWTADCGKDCEIDQADVDAIVKKILEFDERRDHSRVAKMQVYIATQKFNEEGIELFFEAMQELQRKGVIQWASQKEAYEIFVAWEK